MNIILFRYSPGVIQLESAADSNSIVLVPSNQKEKYETYVACGNKLPQILFIDDYTLPNIVRAIKEIAKKTAIKSISTLSEEDMMFVGLLNDHFVRKNTTYAINTFFQDKYIMRSFVIDEVNQPYFRLLENETDLFLFWEKSTTDIAVIKPRIGAGSKEIIKVKRHDSQHLSQYCNGAFLIEEFIPMERMLTCDGYAVGNKICRFFSHEYEELLLNTLDTSKEFTIRTNHLYMSENKLLLRKAFQESQKVLRVFAGNDELTPFHFEWFYDTSTSEFYFCEVGKRFGGGAIPKLIEHAFGVDVLKEYWQIQTGQLQGREINENEINDPYQIAATYSPYKKQGRLISLPPLEAFDWTERTTISVALNQNVTQAKTVMEGLFTTLFISQDETEYKQQLQQLQTLAEAFIFQNE